MRRALVLFGITLAVSLAAFCLVNLAACAVTPPAAHIAGNTTGAGGALHSTAVSLDWVILVATVVAGALLGFYFTPQGHTISGTFLAPALGVWGFALFTRVVLPYGTIIAVVLTVAGLLFLVYEFFTNRPAVENDVKTIVAAAEAAGSKVAAKL